MNETHLYTIERNWGMESARAEIYLEAIREIDFAQHMREFEASIQDRSSQGDGPGYEVDANGIAHFKVEGPITKKMSSMQSMFGGTSSIGLARAFDRASMDPLVKGALANFDTPGGAIGGLTTAESAMQRFRKKKPIVGYVDGLCASAGYWLGSQCDALYGDPSCIAGHIGVYQALTDTSERMAREGVKRIVVKSAPGKGAGTPGTEITAEQLADIQREVDTFHAMFESAIVRGRNMEAKKVSAVADGRGYIGEEAVKVGLLDGIEDQSGAYKALLKLIEEGRVRSSKGNKGMADEEKDEAAKAGYWDRFMAFVKGGETVPVVAVPNVATVDLSTHPEIVALKKQNEQLQEQLAIRAEAEKDMVTRRNEEQMEAYAMEGKFHPANLALESESRAANPEVYDRLWATRPVLSEYGGPSSKPKQGTVDAKALADKLLKLKKGEQGTQDNRTAVDDMMMAQVKASVGKKEDE